MSSSKNKSEFLGMPHGTACNRLKKMILFRMLVKLNEDNCYRCQKKIVTELDLSIEHKKPWEGRSVDLFWDLDNIAFSHVSCNRPHSFNPTRKIGPDGTSWCFSCRKFRPVEEFHKGKKFNGLKNQCKRCFQEYRIARR